MSTEEKYLRDLEVLSEQDPLVHKSPQELCFIAVDDTSPNQLSAIKRLKAYEGQAVTAILVNLTAVHHDPYVRQQALESLAEREGAVVTRTFERFIQDENPEVRKSVLQIARSASEQVRTVVSLYAIDDEDTGVREMADEVFFTLPGSEF